MCDTLKFGQFKNNLCENSTKLNEIKRIMHSESKNYTSVTPHLNETGQEKCYFKISKRTTFGYYDPEPISCYTRNSVKNHYVGAS